MKSSTIPGPEVQLDDIDDIDVDTEAIMPVTLRVSMLDGHVVICPPAHLDLEMTEVVIVAAASAVTAGATVMIDLDPDVESGELVARRPVSSTVTNCVTGDGGPVSIPSAGHVRLRARDSYWTIDLARGRLFRSDEPVEPRFLGAGDWTRIHALWVSPVDIVALDADGSYISTRAAWSDVRRNATR